MEDDEGSRTARATLCLFGLAACLIAVLIPDILFYIAGAAALGCLTGEVASNLLFAKWFEDGAARQAEMEAIACPDPAACYLPEIGQGRFWQDMVASNQAHERDR